MSLDGYNIFRNDRILAESDPQFDNTHEYIITEIKKSNSTVVIAIIYRWPGTSSLIGFFETSSNFSSNYQYMVITRDFNADLLNPTNTKIFRNFVEPTFPYHPWLIHRQPYRNSHWPHQIWIPFDCLPWYYGTHTLLCNSSTTTETFVTLTSLHFRINLAFTFNHKSFSPPSRQTSIILKHIYPQLLSHHLT